MNDAPAPIQYVAPPSNSRFHSEAVCCYSEDVRFHSEVLCSHVICSTKARQDILVFVTNHENLLRLLVPEYLSARFVAGNELWWEVDISA